MKKNLVLVSVLLAIVSAVTGCTVNNYATGAKSGAGSVSVEENTQKLPSKIEIASYREKVLALGFTESDLLDRYGSVTGENYVDDATTYEELVSLLPDVQAFIGELEAINPANQELHAIHQEFVDGWNFQAKGMTLVTAALEEQDTSKIAEGNDALAKGRALLRQFQLDFAALGK
ncbi:MAG: hypothetical protein ACKORF_04885 [Micrococcales bacterium]